MTSIHDEAMAIARSRLVQAFPLVNDPAVARLVDDVAASVAELLIGSHQGDGPTVRLSEYRVLPTGYDESTISDKYGFELSVAWRGIDPATGDDRWAVLHRGSCLMDDGTWENERLPSNRRDDWLDRCRYPRTEALRLAVAVVDRVKINRRTFAEWEAHFAADDESTGS